jgi:hypothetical protein
MGETVMLVLENIAYMAGRADSVEKRRSLDLLLRETATSVESSAEDDEQERAA